MVEKAGLVIKNFIKAAGGIGYRQGSINLGNKIFKAAGFKITWKNYKVSDCIYKTGTFAVVAV